MDCSDRIQFEPVIAAGLHLHCYLDNYYIARITPHADQCAIDGPGFAPCHVPNEEEAREVVRMWVRWSKQMQAESSSLIDAAGRKSDPMQLDPR